MMDAADVAEAPIHAINSGPAMAPVAGRHYRRSRRRRADTAIVADTGGTSYDVSLVRQGRIPWTRETWLGQRFRGHMTGFPSVDVKSIGAGGGSIAWVDEGGLLHVGPESAGSMPGPACYGQGGTQPTVTDAALVLGYLDPGVLPRRRACGSTRGRSASRYRRSRRGPARARARGRGRRGRRARDREAWSARSRRSRSTQGIDPADAVLIGGGGAAGLNAVAIARRLGCPGS